MREVASIKYLWRVARFSTKQFGLGIILVSSTRDLGIRVDSSEGTLFGKGGDFVANVPSFAYRCVFWLIACFMYGL